MTIFNQLPEKIQKHLTEITKTSGLPEGDESLEKIALNWTEKRDLFKSQIACLGMVECGTFAKDQPRGALMLTYSGSLISIGTLQEESRWFEYASIKLRHDVPDILKGEKVTLTSDTGVDHSAEFEGAPLKKTSSLLLIACCTEDVPLDEQEKRIQEATLFLTNGFVKINQTLYSESRENGGAYNQFNKKSMSGYIAKRNGITKKLAARIIDDYQQLIETGMLLGEKVPLGRLGALSLKIIPSRKARIGRNPLTGEELTIKARPEMPGPKFSFSKYIKERSSMVDPNKLKGTENAPDHEGGEE